MALTARRVYDAPSPDDGYRVLVDRLWPRGVSQAAGRIDLWLRDIAPSTDLRTWYGHDIERWPEFRARYTDELVAHRELLDLIRDIERHRERVTLLFSARDQEHNEARVLLDVLRHWPAHAHR